MVLPQPQPSFSGEMTLHMAGRKVYLSLVSLYRTDLGLMGTRLGKGSPKNDPVLK